jgi:hypothetical protein
LVFIKPLPARPPPRNVAGLNAEAKRAKSAREAMALFNQAFLARNRMWAERRWDAIAGIFGKIVEALSRKHLDEKGVIIGRRG